MPAALMALAGYRSLSRKMTVKARTRAQYSREISAMPHRWRFVRFSSRLPTQRFKRRRPRLFLNSRYIGSWTSMMLDAMFSPSSAALELPKK